MEIKFSGLKNGRLSIFLIGLIFLQLIVNGNSVPVSKEEEITKPVEKDVIETTTIAMEPSEKVVAEVKHSIDSDTTTTTTTTERITTTTVEPEITTTTAEPVVEKKKPVVKTTTVEVKPEVDEETKTTPAMTTVKEEEEETTTIRPKPVKTTTVASVEVEAEPKVVKKVKPVVKETKKTSKKAKFIEICTGSLQSPWFCNLDDFAEDKRCSHVYSLKWTYEREKELLEIKFRYQPFGEEKVALGLVNVQAVNGWFAVKKEHSLFDDFLYWNEEDETSEITRLTKNYFRIRQTVRPDQIKCSGIGFFIYTTNENNDTLNYHFHASSRSEVCPSTCSICLSKPDMGIPCTVESESRFYFNKKYGRCVEFIYSGCGGNQNNFLTLEACHSRCAPHLLEEQKAVKKASKKSDDDDEDDDEEDDEKDKKKKSKKKVVIKKTKRSIVDEPIGDEFSTPAKVPKTDRTRELKKPIADHKVVSGRIHAASNTHPRQIKKLIGEEKIDVSPVVEKSEKKVVEHDHSIEWHVVKTTMPTTTTVESIKEEEVSTEPTTTTRSTTTRRTTTTEVPEIVEEPTLLATHKPVSTTTSEFVETTSVKPEEVEEFTTVRTSTVGPRFEKEEEEVLMSSTTTRRPTTSTTTTEETTTTTTEKPTTTTTTTTTEKPTTTTTTTEETTTTTTTEKPTTTTTTTTEPTTTTTTTTTTEPTTMTTTTTTTEPTTTTTTTTTTEPTTTTTTTTEKPTTTTTEETTTTTTEKPTTTTTTTTTEKPTTTTSTTTVRVPHVTTTTEVDDEPIERPTTTITTTEEEEIAVTTVPTTVEKVTTTTILSKIKDSISKDIETTTVELIKSTTPVEIVTTTTLPTTTIRTTSDDDKLMDDLSNQIKFEVTNYTSIDSNDDSAETKSYSLRLHIKGYKWNERFHDVNSPEAKEFMRSKILPLLYKYLNVTPDELNEVKLLRLFKGSVQSDITVKSNSTSNLNNVISSAMKFKADRENTPEAEKSAIKIINEELQKNMNCSNYYTNYTLTVIAEKTLFTPSFNDSLEGLFKNAILKFYATSIDEVELKIVDYKCINKSVVVRLKERFSKPMSVRSYTVSFEAKIKLTPSYIKSAIELASIGRVDCTSEKREEFIPYCSLMTTNSTYLIRMSDFWIDMGNTDIPATAKLIEEMQLFTYKPAWIIGLAVIGGILGIFFVGCLIAICYTRRPYKRAGKIYELDTNNRNQIPQIPGMYPSTKTSTLPKAKELHY